VSFVGGATVEPDEPEPPSFGTCVTRCFATQIVAIPASLVGTRGLGCVAGANFRSQAGRQVVEFSVGSASTSQSSFDLGICLNKCQDIRLQSLYNGNN